jgi:purine-binding chemotaxis protein CheW
MGKIRMDSLRTATGILDWGAIYRRLEAIQETIDHGWTLTLEEKKQILRTRAIALAQESPKKESGDETLEVLEFLLAHEHYGIELNYVREVYPLKNLTPLPGTPAFILGVTNVRRQVLSVIDIKRLVGLPDKGLADFNKTIIIQTPGKELGILADAVLGLKSVLQHELQPSLPTLTGIREDILRGVTGQSMVILDAKKLLSAWQTGWGEG